MTATGWALSFIEEMKAEAEGKLPRHAQAWGLLLQSYHADPDFKKALARVAKVLPWVWQRNQILICLTDTFIGWGPRRETGKKIGEREKNALKRAIELNTEIAKDAVRLAGKLAARRDLISSSGIGGYAGESLLECIQAWIRTSELFPYRFQNLSDPGLCSMYILPELERMATSFDGKYWPDMHGLLLAMSGLAECETEPCLLVHDDITWAAIGRESSRRVFLRAFLQRLTNETLGGPGYALPDGIVWDIKYLRHTDIASLVNAILDKNDGGISNENVAVVRNEMKKADNSA